jgi:hypothetical protein
MTAERALAFLHVVQRIADLNSDVQVPDFVVEMYDFVKAAMAELEDKEEEE